MWIEDTLTDSVLGAMQECIRAAHDAAVGHAADLSSVLGRISELFREHGDPGAGYWRVRASSAEASSVVFEVLLGERLPGGAAISSKVRLSSEAGSGDGSAVSATGPPPVGKWRGGEEAEAGPQTADRYQRIPPSGIRERVRQDRVSITGDGRVVLIRCHAVPQPEHATDDDMTTLTSLCQWLHEQCHRIASGSAVDFASSMTAGQRAKLRGAELFVAYDAEHGLGAWLHRELAAGVDAALRTGQPELHPRPDSSPASATGGSGPEGDNKDRARPAGSGPADASGNARSAPRPGHAAQGPLPVGEQDDGGAGTSGLERGGASRSQESRAVGWGWPVSAWSAGKGRSRSRGRRCWRRAHAARFPASRAACLRRNPPPGSRS